MLDLFYYVFLLALCGLAVVAGLALLKAYSGGQSTMVRWLGERQEKRLAVVEHANVDGRRRLVLVRRDGVEHLIMTGGPVDLVIETGIGSAQLQPMQGDAADTQQQGFVRPARTFGRVQRPAKAAE